jgi:hypothetical protein
MGVTHCGLVVCDVPLFTGSKWNLSLLSRLILGPENGRRILLRNIFLNDISQKTVIYIYIYIYIYIDCAGLDLSTHKCQMFVSHHKWRLWIGGRGLQNTAVGRVFGTEAEVTGILRQLYIAEFHNLHSSQNIIFFLFFHGRTALVSLGRFYSSLIYTQLVWLLGRGISPPLGRDTNTE